MNKYLLSWLLCLTFIWVAVFAVNHVKAYTIIYFSFAAITGISLFVNRKKS